MSRNKEKAQAVLNRYYSQTSTAFSLENQRPRSVKSVTTIKECQHWRNHLIRDARHKITKIQAPVLTEAQILELNETINKLMKEKTAWEYHIIELGGPNYLQTVVPGVTHAGVQIEPKGERYFGRAKELPHVKEALDAKARMNADEESVLEIDSLPTNLSGWYFGLVDPSAEDLAEEQEYLRKLVESRTVINAPVKPISIYHPLPTTEQIEQHLVELKREQLLAKLHSIN